MKKLTYHPLLFITIFICSISLANANPLNPFTKRPEVKTFINEMAKKYDFKPQELNKLFANYKSSKHVVKKITKPFEKVYWGKYKKLFLSKKRINNGVKFWAKHKSALQQAEKKYGVPSEIIISIIGVETFYGANKGNIPVLQSLLTLAFDYPKRSNFFRKELEEYLLLTKENKLDPLALKGSYAGAMGIPQFISSSYRNYAVTLNNKKGTKIDLINDVEAAIASIANYFKKHGWEQNQPVAHKASVTGHAYKSFLSTNTEKPKYSSTLLTKNNIKVKSKLNRNEKFSLIELNTGKNKEYWLGANNFYVITRYNHSYNYAMAVYQLAQAIKKQRVSALTKAKTNSKAKRKGTNGIIYETNWQS